MSTAKTISNRRDTAADRIIAIGWQCGAKAKSQQREMIEVFLRRHSRGQLDVLAQDLCAGRQSPDGHEPAPTWIREAKNKEAQVERLLALHTSAAPLPLPESIKDTPVVRKRKRGE